MPTNRQIILRERPEGRLAVAHFELREGEVPVPGPGEALVRTVYLSLDAANRAWMSKAPTYTHPVQIGGVMDGMVLATVEQSNDASLKPGDLVEATTGWQDYGVGPARQMRKVAPTEPLSLLLSGVGITGKTATSACSTSASRSRARRCWSPRRPAPSARSSGRSPG
jgi:NADPH-dependent curcumin reductase CurA